MSDLDLLEQINRKLSAILALLCEDREGNHSGGGPGPSRRKTVNVLSEAGLKNLEIATILGKNEPAIRMALQRSRKAGANTKEDQNGKDEQ
jgi:hypothetical protein